MTIYSDIDSAKCDCISHILDITLLRPRYQSLC